MSPEARITSREDRLLVFVLVLASITASMVQTLMVPVLPLITRDTGATTLQTGWLVTGTLLTGTVLTPVFGRCGDLLGPGRVLLLCLGLSASGALVVAASSSIAVMIAGRAIQGASLGVIPASIALVYSLQPLDAAQRTVGWLSSSLGIGGAAGVPLGSLLADLSGWRTLFWVMAAALALLAAALLLLGAGRARGAGGRFDGLGALLLCGALIAVLVPISEYRQLAPGLVAGVVLAGLVSAVLWCLWERRVRDPLVDLRVARTRPVILSLVFSVLIGFGFFANTMTSSLMVQAPVSTGYGLGASTLVGGLAALPSGIAMIVCSPLAARWARRSGPRIVLTVGAAVMAGGYVLRTFLHDSLLLVLVGTSVVGVGICFTYACIPMYVMSCTPLHKRSEVSGLTVLSRMIGTTVNAAAISALLAAFTLRVEGSVQPSTTAYEVVFIISAAVSALALLVSAFLPRPSFPSVPGAASWSGTQDDGDDRESTTSHL